MSKPQLIICGSIAIDRLMSFPGRYSELIDPDKLEILSLSVLLDKMVVSHGGVGANIAYNIACLGENPLLLDSAGFDAAEYVQHLQGKGVNTEHVHHSKLPTASFSVFTDLDSNQMGGFYPGAMSDADTLSLEPWKDENVFICLSAHDPASMRSQAEECSKYGLRMLYDPAQQVSALSGEDLAAGIEAAEVVAVNEYEHGMLCRKTGWSPEELASKVEVLIITRGKQGALISGRSQAEPLEIGVAAAEKVVDPTGAGDAYRAGFLYGYLRQWDLKACGQLAAAVSSFVIEQPGTQVDLSKEAVQQRYKEAFNEEVTF